MIRSLAPSFVHPFLHSLIRWVSFFHSFVHRLLIHSLIYFFIVSLIRWFTGSFDRWFEHFSHFSQQLTRLRVVLGDIIIYISLLRIYIYMMRIQRNNILPLLILSG